MVRLPMGRRALSRISSDRAESSCREFMMLTVELLG